METKVERLLPGDAEWGAASCDFSRGRRFADYFALTLAGGAAEGVQSTPDIVCPLFFIELNGSIEVRIHHVIGPLRILRSR